MSDNYEFDADEYVKNFRESFYNRYGVELNESDPVVYEIHLVADLLKQTEDLTGRLLLAHQTRMREIAGKWTEREREVLDRVEQEFEARMAEYSQETANIMHSQVKAIMRACIDETAENAVNRALDNADSRLHNFRLMAQFTVMGMCLSVGIAVGMVAVWVFNG